MGISKTYLKFNPGPILGMIASRSSPVLLLSLPSDQDAILICIVAVLENLVLWNVKLSSIHSMLIGGTSMVTSFCHSYIKHCIAVGYNDGKIKLWDLGGQNSFVTLNGHASSLRYLVFSSNGLRLASGEDNGNIILWDVVSYNGLFRLKGHVSLITSITFIRDLYLVSTSKDCLIKIWDLITVSCFQTIIDHSSEIISNVLICDMYMITGSLDGKLRIYSRVHESGCSNLNLNSKFCDHKSNPFHFEFIGFIDKKSAGKVKKLIFNKPASIVIAQCVSSFEYIKLKYSYDSDLETPLINNTDFDLLNEFRSISSIFVQRQSYVFLRKKSVDFNILHRCNDFLMALNLGDNIIEIYSIDSSFNSIKLFSLSQFHHNDVRCLSFSFDSQLLAACSSDEVSIWNPRKQYRLASIIVKDVLSCCFILGDKFLIVGTRSGFIHLIHINSSTLMVTIHLHSDAIWSVILQPSSNVVATCSSDKFLKLASVNFTSTSTLIQQDISFIEETSLSLPEEILYLKYSSDAKLLALSLFDNTVKIFLVATMKIILALYGHHLPVLCLDISHDCTILASGSVDRCIKIWSLDFGDCLHSIYAHEDAIVSIVFIPNTHQLFSASRDKTLKLFDLDIYQQSYSLRGHQDRIYSIAISPDGYLLASSSHDMSVRIWERSSEQFFISERIDNLSELEDQQMYPR